MTATPPIACTLEPGEKPGRRAEVVSLGRDALLAVESGNRVVTLQFVDTEEHTAQLDSFVAAESACCAFLDFERWSADGRQLLRIEAPEGGELMLDEIVAAFQAEATKAARS